MINKYRKHIEITIKVFESYNIDENLIENIAACYNSIAHDELNTINLPLSKNKEI